MLERLLESKVRRDRQLAGTAVSVVAHTAIVGAALFATARARPASVKTQTQPPVRFYVATPAPLATRSGSPTVSAGPGRRFTFAAPDITVNVPRIDIATSIGAISVPESGGLASLSNVLAAGSSSAPPTSGTFRADQVEKQVSLMSGTAAPRYPEALRSAGIEGGVTARFVVSERGIVETDSIAFTHSDNVLFEAAVRDALRRMRFAPAEVGGRKVRQLVEMPFVFTLKK